MEVNQSLRMWALRVMGSLPLRCRCIFVVVQNAVCVLPTGTARRPKLGVFPQNTAFPPIPDQDTRKTNTAASSSWSTTPSFGTGHSAHGTGRHLKTVLFPYNP